MKTSSSHNKGVSEPVRWLWLLPRWSLMVSLVTLSLPIILLGLIGQQATDNALGAEFVELLQAVRSPGLYRVGWTIDALIWALIGGNLLIFGGILRRHAPITAGFIGVTGLAQLIGFLGAFIRVQGTSDLALAYTSAASDQQSAILNSYLNLWRVIKPHFHVALLFSGLGFSLAAWSCFPLRGFPRWLAVWLAIPGVLGLTQFILVAAGMPFSRPINYIGLVVGNIALNFAIAGALWHPPSMLIKTLSGQTKGEDQ